MWTTRTWKPQSYVNHSMPTCLIAFFGFVFPKIKANEDSKQRQEISFLVWNLIIEAKLSYVLPVVWWKTFSRLEDKHWADRLRSDLLSAKNRSARTMKREIWCRKKKIKARARSAFSPAHVIWRIVTQFSITTHLSKRQSLCILCVYLL